MGTFVNKTSNLGDSTHIFNNVYTVGLTDGENSVLVANIATDDDLNLKADKATTYTKTEIDAKLVAAMRFKGSVADVDSLPTEDVEVGDVYNVEDTGANYAWDGEAWDKLSENIDLSNIYTKTEVDNLLADKADADDVYTKTEVDTALALKAPLASPAFTGTPTAPTPASTDDSTKVATTAYVKAQGYADASDVYTKTEVDNLLDDKADKTEIHWQCDSNNNFIPV